MSTLSAQSRAVADRFTQAWQTYPGAPSPPPDLDTYLGQTAVPDRLPLFQTLLRADLEQRLRRGLMPSIRYYLKCFPEYGDEVRKTFDAPLLMDRLGRGGMGEVYRAFDFVARRSMAVKRILTPATADASTADSQSLQRFYAEARAVSALHHPNIVQTYSVGHQDGVPYLCMELVEGGSLAARVKEGPRKPREAAAIVEALAHGVQHAHDHGIIHRDLKPANVLMATDGTPKVTDFGLAKLSDDSCGLTHTGAVMGTPEYMAPEQAEGRTKEITPATDVWALGGILYALLTGRPAFRAEGRENLRDVLRKVSHEAPIPPRVLCPDVHADLEVICLKCLEKLPRDRYASAQELAADLRRFLDGNAIRARSISLGGRVWRWGLKNKAITASGVAVVLLLPATLVFAVLAYVLFQQFGKSQGDVAQTKEAKDVAEIIGLQDRADNLLNQARKATDSQLALDRIAEAVALREQTQVKLAGLPSPTPDFVADHQQRWHQRWGELRDEATRRLTRTDLRLVRSVTVPGPIFDESRPGGAVSPDGSWFVLGYSWDHKLRLVRRDTGDVQELMFPRELPKPKNQFGGTGFPALAVSPEGRSIAVLYPTADELIVVAPDGQGFRTFPLHQGMGRTSSLAPDAIRFPEENRIEVDDASGSWGLTPSNGKWSLPAPGRQPPRNLPGLGPMTTKRLLTAGDRLLTHDLESGQVLVSFDGGSPRFLWSDVAGTPSGEKGERCEEACFGTDPRHVYLLTSKRLRFVNADTGTPAEVELGPSSPSIKHRSLFPTRDGVALLRQGLGERLDITFLSASLAPIPVPTLGHPAPVRVFDLADDGRLATAAEKLIHVWNGLHQERTWGAKRPPLNTPYSLPATAQSACPWWGFVPGPQARLVIDRREPPPAGPPMFGHTELVKTEVYDSEDGRLLHTFPALGVGRIVRGGAPGPQLAGFGSDRWSAGFSSDRRFAVVVAAEKGDNAELELWSVSECKSIANLGRHPLTQAGLSPGLGMIFSPNDRWLLMVNQPSSAPVLLDQSVTARVTFWKLPEGKRTGEIAFPMQGGGFQGQLACHFDADEDRVLVTQKGFGGNETVSGSPAWVIDLEAGKRRSVLEEFETLSKGARIIVAGEDALVPSRVPVAGGFQPGKRIGSDNLPCTVWSLSTGKRSDLGQPWGQMHAIEVSPDGRRALLLGKIKALDFGLGGVADRASDVQLWDLTERKLLRKDKVVVGGFPWAVTPPGQNSVLEPVVAGDRDNVYLVPGPNDRGERQRPIVWRWSDGATVKSQDRALLTVSPGEGWLLWGAGGKVLVGDRVTGATVELQDSTGTHPQMHLSPDRRTAYLPGKSADGRADRSGLWDVRTGELLARVPAGHNFIGFEATGRFAITRDLTREITLVDLHGGPLRSLKLPLNVNPTPAFGVGGVDRRAPIQVRPDGARLAVPVQGEVLLWDVPANRPVDQLRTSGHSGSIYAVTQHSGRQLIASAGDDRMIHLWERQGERLLKQMVGHTAPILALAFRPDGGAVASASADGSVILWRTDGTTVWSSPLNDVRTLLFPAHGRFLVCGTGAGRVVLLNPESGAIQAEQPTDGSAVIALACSRGGEVLAAGTTKGQVSVWSSGERDLVPLRSWQTETSVTALAWLPTRNVLLTGGDAVRFWEMRSVDGRPPCVWTLEVSRPKVRALAASESGRELFVADEGGQLARFELQKLSDGLRKWNLEVPGLFGAAP